MSPTEKEAETINETSEDHTNRDSYRQYNEAPARVLEFYWNQHTQLTFEKALQINNSFTGSTVRPYAISELLAICDDVFDPSDPDTNLSQTEHAYQTAHAAIRRGMPDVYAVIGLIHDLGKAVVKLLGIEMTYLVGDTYPLGCPFEFESITHGESLARNPDRINPMYNRGFGVYYEGCGFDRMVFTGHDEIIYQSLLQTEQWLPEWALYAVRYHSFYPWHTHGAYAKYASDKDHQYLPYVRRFNECDLYTKHADPVDAIQRKMIDELVVRYLPNGLMFPTKRT